MVDLAMQRKNMVESQVRPSDVTDRRIVAAMLEVPREAFVPAAFATLAYSDGDARVVAPGSGRFPRALMAPRVFAKLVDLAQLSAGDVVLDVGIASGYSAAVIGRMVETVVALECDAALAAEASKKLAALSQDNVAVVQGELEKGWPSAAPYDAIILEGSVSEVPEALLDQLKDGGRLVAVLSGTSSTAAVWHKRGANADVRPAFDASAPPLPGFQRKPAFVL